MKIARLYLRVSTDQQDLTRQDDIEQSTRAAGYYVNLTGDYIWQQSRQVEPGKFRPLRPLKKP